MRNLGLMRGRNYPWGGSRSQQYEDVADICRWVRRCSKCGGVMSLRSLKVWQFGVLIVGEQMALFRGFIFHTQHVEQVRSEGNISYAETGRKVEAKKTAEEERGRNHSNDPA